MAPENKLLINRSALNNLKKSVMSNFNKNLPKHTKKYVDSG